MKIKRLAREQSGVSLIETVISSCIILFILSSSFLVFNSNMINSSVSGKRVELVDQLDRKINKYLLTGVFSTSRIGQSTFFYKKASSPKLVKFVAKNTAFNVEVSKEILRHGKTI
ncbi:MAG: hypothetical protein ACI9BN_001015 [Francisella sp.]|jgi:Tfp pilus assembly protein PilV